MAVGDQQAGQQTAYSSKWFSPKFLIVYLVVAVVVYGLVYFLFLAKRSSNSQSQQTTSEQSEQQIPQSSPPIEKVYTLNSLNDSNEGGSAILTAIGAKTEVFISLKNAPKDTNQPAHIHVGVCPQVGEIKYPLKNVVNGRSSTVLDVTISELVAKGLAVNVHKSMQEQLTAVSCGNLQ